VTAVKIATIIGARPQFIKMVPVSRELRKRGIEEVIIHTGQHYDYEMDRIFFEQLNIPEPDYNLGVGSGSHGYQTGEMLKRIEEVLMKEKPDLVIVYGDTNSTLAGALAAVKLHIKVAHVEAGLRSFDKKMPEEINRVLTDHVSDYLFAPTKTAVENLYNEGIRDGVYLTGDVMLDALLCNIKIAEKESRILDELGLKPKEYYLATVHRAENTDNGKNLENIVEAFIECGELIVFPAHPRTVKFLKSYGFYERLEKAKNLILIKPVGYLDMLVLEKNARKILTDSGGVQKEAYFLKVPCITLRDRTEWVETVEDSWNLLVGADRNRILKAIREFEPKMENYAYKFGDGKASERISKTLEYKIKKREQS
jgi:UDP-N-acetylglucosamine 2-epimerase